MSDLLFCAPERHEANRFVLRSYRAGDGPLLADATNSSYEHIRPYMHWAVPHQSDAEAERTVRRFMAAYITSEDFVLGIFAPDGSRLLGSTGYHLNGKDRTIEQRSAEVGMWIRTDASGQGMGSAVLRALIEWGFTEWPWERLFWRCVADNEASARTARSAGMLPEGRQRGFERRPDGSRTDQLLFSLLKSEWEEYRGRNHSPPSPYSQ